jgi:tetratricopeptide (TPR) repeat protein
MSGSNKDTRTHIRAGADATGDYRASLDATADGGTVGSTRVAAPAESTPAGELGTVHGRYKIGAEIARGGMGIVYAARDLAFERDIAVKTVRGDRAWSESTVERFFFESRVTGRLQHPGIPPVHDLGKLPDGRPFLVMKLIRGRTLAEHLDDSARVKDRDRWIRVFEQLAETVGFAHAEGVIHRDLKPANVMIGAFGEVQVMDWGLAKLPGTAGDVPVNEDDGDEDAGSRTRAGSVMGTPAYMPPEQATGDLERLGPPADVFALGAILCEILTGKPPYDGEHTRTILAQAATGNIAEARKRLEACGAALELVQLTERCLAAEPKERPATGSDVARAVAEYRSGVEARLRAVETERAAAEAKAAEAKRRRRTQAALVAAVVVIVGLAGGGLLWRDAQLARQANDVSRRATAALVEATTLHERAREERLDLSRWDAALAAVAAAREAVNDDAADPATRDQVSLFAAAVESEARAAKADFERRQASSSLIERFEKARFVATVGAQDESYNDAAQNKAYAALFQELGLVLSHGTPEDAADRIRNPAIALEIGGALDNWARTLGRATNLMNPERAWLLRVAKSVDNDPVRNAIRDDVIAGTPERILKRMEEPSTADLPVESILCLISAVPDHHDHIAALLRKVWAKRPTDFWIAVELGRCLMPMGQNEESSRCFAAAIAIRPNVPSPHISLGYVLNQLGRKTEAIRAYERAAELEPNAAWPLLNASGLLREVNRPREAEERAVRAIAMIADRPAGERAFYMEHLTWAQLSGPNKEGALATAREIERICPEYGNLGICLGHALVRNGKVQEGIEWYEKALKATNIKPVRIMSFGNELRNAKDLPASDQFIRMAIEKDPNLATPYAEIGWNHYLQGRVEPALENLRKSIALFPSLFLGNQRLGFILQDRGDHRAAIAHFRSAAIARPSDVETQIRLAFLLQNIGEFDAGITAGQTAVKLAPSFERAHSYLAWAYMRKGDYKSAIQSTDEALKLKPDSPLALQWKADALNGLGDAKAALPFAEKALALMPENAWMYVTLGFSLKGVGREAEAKQNFREAARRDKIVIPNLPRDYDKD